MTTKQQEADRSKAGPSKATEQDGKIDDRKVCGIVMPIAAMGEEYPEAHWSRVRRVLQRAIDRAGLRSQLVWENPEVDVIQTAILQNIFENDVVICDVSNLNPNVMLETGLRLSTKRPTIIVTDKIKRPPFDISTISYIDYPRDLEYNATEDFISKLSIKIIEFVKAVDEDRYKPYIEQFRFETVQPDTVNVTTDQYVLERLDDLTSIMQRFMRDQENSKIISATKANKASSTDGMPLYGLMAEMPASFIEDYAVRAKKRIDSIDRIKCEYVKSGNESFTFNIYGVISDPQSYAKINKCLHILRDEERIYRPG